LPPLHRGEKAESLIECTQKSSPPFGKGRPGGIYGKDVSSGLEFILKYAAAFKSPFEKGDIGGFA